MFYIIIIALILFLLMSKSSSEPSLIINNKYENVNGYIETMQYYNQVKDIVSGKIEPKYILGMIFVESKGNPDAKGSSGELGLMQLTQGACTDVGYSYIPTEPKENIKAGFAYLLLLKSRIDKNEKNEIKSLETAIRAYNVGYSKVMGYPDVGNDYLKKVLKASEMF